jgi:hypothetical protein
VPCRRRRGPRLGVVQDEYHWHKHEADDAFFYVVDGRFWPQGELHRPRAPERTVILMVETAGIVPTGD